MFEDNWSCHLLLLITPLGKYFDNTIARPIKKHKKLQLWHLPVTAINDGITANLVIWVSKYLQCLLKTLCKKKAYSNTEVTNVERKKKNTLKLYCCIKICYWEDFLTFPILVRHFLLSIGFKANSVNEEKPSWKPACVLLVQFSGHKTKPVLTLLWIT